MSLLFRAGRKPTEVRSDQPGLTVDQWIRLAGGSASVTSTSVQAIETALTQSVVWRCAMKNAATLAAMPVHTKRDLKPVTDPAIVHDPAGDASLHSSWVFAVVLSMYLRGGGYGLIGSDGSARAQRVPLLHPDRVTWAEARGWAIDGESADLWPVGRLWHCPMYVLPGSPKGLNPLQYARRALFPGLTAQEFGANFFRDGGHPTAIISPDKDPGEPAAKALKKRVREATEGTNREPIILPQSVKWTQLQVNPDDSQFIELMRLSDEQVCRYMGTPPEEIGISPSGGGLTYANREQRKQDYLQELLFPMQQLEASWSALIPRPQVVKLTPAGLLRADLKTRYESYKIAADINNATGQTFLSVDEMRAFEEREPLS